MRRRRLSSLLPVVAVVLTLVAPATVAAASGPGGDASLRADLDGSPIELVDVGRWYCEDFAPPAVHCFSTAKALEARTAAVLSTTAVDFVTVYEYPSFAGNYMHMSQDYSVLATIGWNDRISSFKGRNYQSGVFFVDWFYSGASWNFCCNSLVTSLGSFDNTFSSVHRV
jgi:hypothetical protein